MSRWDYVESGPRSLSGVKLHGNNLSLHIYIDETGISAKEKVAVVAGVIVDPDRQYLEVSEEINKLIAEFVPSEHRRNFSFHAKDLFHGTGRTPFDRRTYPPERAREALKRLVIIPAKFCLPVVFGFLNKTYPDPIRDRLRKERKPREMLASDVAIAFSMCAVAAERFMKQHAAPGELATMHAEQNPDTEKMIRLARKSLGGKMRHNLAIFFSKEAQKHLPITRIIDEISFHKKDDAFLLQLADATAFMLRFVLEQRNDCDDLFTAFFGNNSQAAANMQEKMCHSGGAGYSNLRFA